MSSPVVCVVIPCFNQGEYLDEAIASVRQQTFRWFEIIVVNDGSTDPGTLAVFEKVSREGIKVLHTPNRGLAAARNHGIRHSCGDYILPLDADDRIAPDYLKMAVDEIQRDARVGIVYGLVEFFGERTGVWEQPEFTATHLLYENMIVAAAVFRRSDWESVGGYRESMRHGWEDWDFWLSLTDRGRHVVRMPKVMFYYRIRGDSMTRTLTKWRKLWMLLGLMRNHPKRYLLNVGPFLLGLVGYLSVKRL